MWHWLYSWEERRVFKYIVTSVFWRKKIIDVLLFIWNTLFSFLIKRGCSDVASVTCCPCQWLCRWLEDCRKEECCYSMSWWVWCTAAYLLQFRGELSQEKRGVFWVWFRSLSVSGPIHKQASAVKAVLAPCTWSPGEIYLGFFCLHKALNIYWERKSAQVGPELSLDLKV